MARRSHPLSQNDVIRKAEPFSPSWSRGSDRGRSRRQSFAPFQTPPPHTFLFFNLLYIISLVQFESVAMVCLDERRSCWDRKEREGSTEWNYQISFALLSQFFGGGECCHLVECLCDKICASSRGNEHSILGGAYDATPCWFFSSPFERVVAPEFCVRSMESIESLASRFLFCESVT